MWVMWWWEHSSVLKRNMHHILCSHFAWGGFTWGTHWVQSPPSYWSLVTALKAHAVRQQKHVHVCAFKLVLSEHCLCVNKIQRKAAVQTSFWLCLTKSQTHHLCSFWSTPLCWAAPHPWARSWLPAGKQMRQRCKSFQRRTVSPSSCNSATARWQRWGPSCRPDSCCRTESPTTSRTERARTTDGGKEGKTLSNDSPGRKFFDTHIGSLRPIPIQNSYRFMSPD